MSKKITQEKVDKRLFDFDIFYLHLKKFIKENNRLPYVRDVAIDDESYTLGKKFQRVKRGEIIVSEENIKKLNKLGFVWETAKKYTFDEVYAMLKEFKEKKNRLPMRTEKDLNNTCNLGEKLHSMKTRKLTKEQTEKMVDLGFSFEISDRQISPFDEFYDKLINFVKTHKRFPHSSEKDLDGKYEIGSRFNNYKHKRIKMTSEQIQMLQDTGFPFVTNGIFDFEEFYPRLAFFKKIRGRLPRKNDSWDGTDYLFKNLNWIRCGFIKLNEEQKNKLKELGFDAFGVSIGIMNENGLDA